MGAGVMVQSVEMLAGGKRRLVLDNGEVWILYRGEVHKLELVEGTVLSEACDALA